PATVSRNLTWHLAADHFLASPRSTAWSRTSRRSLAAYFSHSTALFTFGSRGRSGSRWSCTSSSGVRDEMIDRASADLTAASSASAVEQLARSRQSATGYFMRRSLESEKVNRSA